MNPKIIEIELLLDKINLLFNSIKNDGQIDKVEAELFLKYIQHLREKFETYGLKTEEKEKFPHPIEKNEFPEIVKHSTDKPLIETPAIKPDEKKTEEIKKITHEVNLKAFEEQANKKETEVKKEPEVKNKSIHKKPLIDFSDEEEEADLNTGLNNKLSKDKRTIADRIINKKPTDLRSVIDLNDRIFFIKKLFKGDSHAFDKTIKQINSFTSVNEVSSFIQQELIAHYKWEASEALERFTEVVKIKFE